MSILLPDFTCHHGISAELCQDPYCRRVWNAICGALSFLGGQIDKVKQQMEGKP